MSSAMLPTCGLALERVAGEARAVRPRVLAPAVAGIEELTLCEHQAAVVDRPRSGRLDLVDRSTDDRRVTGCDGRLREQQGGHGLARLATERVPRRRQGRCRSVERERV